MTQWLSWVRVFELVTQTAACFVYIFLRFSFEFALICRKTRFGRETLHDCDLAVRYRRFRARTSEVLFFRCYRWSKKLNSNSVYLVGGTIFSMILNAPGSPQLIHYCMVPIAKYTELEFSFLLHLHDLKNNTSDVLARNRRYIRWPQKVNNISILTVSFNCVSNICVIRKFVTTLKHFSFIYKMPKKIFGHHHVSLIEPLRMTGVKTLQGQLTLTLT